MSMRALLCIKKLIELTTCYLKISTNKIKYAISREMFGTIRIKFNSHSTSRAHKVGDKNVIEKPTRMGELDECCQKSTQF